MRIIIVFLMEIIIFLQDIFSLVKIPPVRQTKKSCYIFYMVYHLVYMFVFFLLRKINLERMQKCHFVTGIIIRHNVLYKVN